MLPIFPMDGGRVLRALLSVFLVRLRATEIAAAIGMGLVLLLPLVVLQLSGSFSPMLVLVGLFVFLAGQQELAALRYREAQVRRESTLWPGLQTRPQDGAFANEPLIDPRYSGYIWDSRVGAWVLWQNGRPVQAYWVE
jgi:hypothetical protein